MLQVINTIVPVFAVILLGWLLRSREFLPSHLIRPLNQIVYYLAIPAMIFRELASASFQANFNPLLLLGTLVAPVFLFAIAMGLGRLWRIPRTYLGTFLQSSFHGNLGYIGLAVSYYLLGKEGFTRASILAGFLIVLQNFLSVFALQIYAPAQHGMNRYWFFLKKMMGNPVVLSALTGILFSLGKVHLPEPLDRSLKIISGMALPLALLIIGGSISFGLIRSHLSLALGAGCLKLLVLPGLGLLVFTLSGIPAADFVPALILLASPTATITYVMAGEMQGSTELATAAVSLNTLLSAFTFLLWLGRFS